MRVIRVTLSFLALMLLNNGYSQQTIFVDSINLKKDYQIRENIVLETDRNMYMAGEELFVSCTTYEPLLQQILTLSSVIYIELFTSENLIIEQIKVSCVNGRAEGSIQIPRQLSSGKYHIRAYTNYMKNFGAEAFSYGSLTVINPFEEFGYEKDDTVIPALKSMHIYPEGGTIIYNHLNKVVCEFKSSEGFPVRANARVLDKDNNQVTSFATNEYGMGSFDFIPQPGNLYKIEAEAGNVTILKNIELNEQGVALRKVSQDTDQVKFCIQSNKAIGNSIGLELSCYNSTINIPYNPADSLICISTKKLPNGILNFRLKNARGDIISSRSVYIPSVASDLFRAVLNKNSFTNREVVELEIKSNPVVSRELQNISVSVFLIAKNTMDYFITEDKLHYLQSLLYPVLNGRNYPVDAIAGDTSFLENVLLTLESNEVITVPYSQMEYLPERKYDLISGSVVKQDTLPVAYAPVIQTWLDTVSMMEVTTTDENGKFLFKTTQQDAQVLFIGQKTASGKIHVSDEFFPQFITIKKEDWKVSKDLKEMLEQQVLNLQIRDSYNHKFINRRKEIQIPFYIKADNHYNISDYVLLPLLKDFLFEVVPEVMVTESRGGLKIRMHFPSNLPFGNDPLFLVDGIPVFDAEVIGKLKCMDINSLDIITEKYFYKNENFDGIIDIHTKKHDDSIIDVPAGTFYNDFVGVQSQLPYDRLFAPDENTHSPFFRTQLYWNPKIKPGSDYKTVVLFSAPDNKGDYLVRIGSMKTGGFMDFSYTKFSVR